MIKLKSRRQEENAEMVKIRKILEKKNLTRSYRKKEESIHLWYKILSVLRASSLKPLAINVFFRFEKIYPQFFEPLKDALEKSNLRIDYRLYVGSLFMLAFFSSSLLIGILFGMYSATGMNFLTFVSGIILSIIFPFLLVLTAGYLYPFYIINDREKNIKNNIPFMLNHLYAISYASVSLDRAFKMLVEMGEYGELNKEIKRIVDRVEVYGEDITRAMKYVASTTPSDDLKSILFGILSVVESGGNLREYLSEKSNYALFNYSLERKKYVETLSTYADIYTAILIAAPLFLVAILAVINIIPESKIMGLEPLDIMKIGTYVVIPLVNILFLLFLTLTQPEI